MSDDIQTKDLPTRASRLSSCASSEREDSCEAELRDAARLAICGGWSIPARGTLVSGKYRVEERLDAGGMGAVLRATHVVSGKQMALKWLLPGASQASPRFMREACAAGRVSHPNVVDVYDLGTHEGGHYLVMELLRGRTLRKRLDAGKLAPRELMEIMVPVLRGVAAAHAQGVIHRDLKPDNIFLCEGPDGALREPKVLDFGISKISAELDAGQTLTRPGCALGTLPYMSPEQLDDAAAVDERTDIYAAGVMMYEALAGQRPFRASSEGALVRAIMAHRPAPLRTVAPGVPAALERVVMRALSRNARDRQRDAATLLGELQAWAGAEGGAPALRAATGALAKRQTYLGTSAVLLAMTGVLCALPWLGRSGVPWNELERMSPVPTAPSVLAATPLRPKPRQVACGASAPEGSACKVVSTRGAEQVETEWRAPERDRPPAVERTVRRSQVSLAASSSSARARAPRPAVKARAGLIRLEDL